MTDEDLLFNTFHAKPILRPTCLYILLGTIAVGLAGLNGLGIFVYKHMPPIHVAVEILNKLNATEVGEAVKCITSILKDLCKPV